MKIIVSIILITLSFNLLKAQHNHGHHALHPDDTTHVGLGYSLGKGMFEFHARSFVMGTLNQGDLMDYSTMGVGAGLGYYSPSWKGFHLGFSGFFVFQLFEDNIYKKDPITGNSNRYEVLLYDMNDYHNKRDLDRLEELYLTYEKKGFTGILGRQRFESPLLNEQDNRMRPNIFSGLSLNYAFKNGIELTANWFHAVTIRGTVDWYSIGGSLGVYSFGRNPFDTPTSYKGNIVSNGVGVFGFKYNRENWKTQLWNYNADNLFNLTFLRSESELGKKKVKFVSGVEGFYQTALHNGGNADQHITYMLKDEWTFGVGAKIGMKTKNHLVTFNYLGINNSGRFKFPREWGRDQFFAVLPRERFEGAGGLSAYTLKYRYTVPKNNFWVELGMNYTNHSDISNVVLNKYGIPSYYHFSAVADYRFKGFLEGFDLKLIVVNKLAQNPSEVPDSFRINRVDMWNFNLIIDYRF